jgi:hypothetical protein
MRRLSLIACLVVVLAVCGGCGIAAKVRARDDMESSKATYKRCLELNADDPNKCEALRRVYEADIKAYRETSKGIRPGATISVDQD